MITQARALQPDIESVVITGHNTFDSAVEALRVGAYDCIQKPFSNDHLVRVLTHAVERRRLRLSALDHQARVEALHTLHAVARASSSSLLVDEILDAALTVTLDRLGADGASVGFLDPVGGMDARVQSRPADAGSECLKRAVTGSDPLIAPIYLSDASVEHPDLLALPGDTAAALVAEGYIVWSVPSRRPGGAALGALLAAWRAPPTCTRAW